LGYNKKSFWYRKRRFAEIKQHILIKGGLKMARRFTLEYWLDDGFYVGRLKEVPGVFSQGETLKDLKENIIDAYNLMLEDEEETLPNVIKRQVKRIEVEV